MKLKVLFFISFLSLLSSNVAQSSFKQWMVGPPELFKEITELSGATLKGDTLFMVSESCGKILMADVKDSSMVYTVDIVGLRANPELEAICYYKGFFYMTDEKNKCIYKCSYKSDQMNYTFMVNKVLTSSKLDNLYDNNKGDIKGIEGIAIKNDKIYVLWEKNLDSNRSELLVFNLKDNAIDYVKCLYLDLPEPKDKWRYSDLCYWGDTLFLLKSSHYSATPKSNSYVVEYLDKIERYKDQSNAASKEYAKIDLENINRFEFATNLEGICTNGKNIYIVSDNNDKCERAKLLPLLLKGKISQ